MFSSRLDPDAESDPLVALLAAKKREGRDVIDLTESNPTRAGIDLAPLGLPSTLAHPDVVRYEPSPQGALVAREAVAAYYRAHGATVDVERVLLTASTSEAYSFLFRMLCDPGDEVLVPSPGYPLFDFLAALDAVHPIAYPLRRRERWQVHLERLEASIGPRTRAVIVVSPHNPTGHVLSDSERQALVALCAEREIALIVDEVFLDFAATTGRSRTVAGEAGALTFVLSGLSKVTATPQVKLGWMVVSGPAQLVESAWRRLEFVADTYLSVSSAAQLAAPSLLARREAVQAPVRARLATNVQAVRDACARTERARILEGEGGWYAVLELDGVDARRLTLERLRDADVFAHPGAFYDFEDPSIVVVGLLPPPERFRQGLDRLLAGLV